MGFVQRVILVLVARVVPGGGGGGCHLLRLRHGERRWKEDSKRADALDERLKRLGQSPDGRDETVLFGKKIIYYLTCSRFAAKKKKK